MLSPGGVEWVVADGRWPASFPVMGHVATAKGGRGDRSWRIGHGWVRHWLLPMMGVLGLGAAGQGQGQTYHVPEATHRWRGSALEVSFRGEAGRRYLLETSVDGGATWVGGGPWVNGTGEGQTLRRRWPRGPTEPRYRLVVQRSKNRLAGRGLADVNHILIGGQSNAVGHEDDGSPPLSVEQPFANVMFNPFVQRRYLSHRGALIHTEYFASGLRAPHCPISRLYYPLVDEVAWMVRDSEYYRTAGVVTHWVPLREAAEPLVCCNVAECAVAESMGSTLANTLTARYGSRFLVSAHAVGALPVEELNKAAERDQDHAIDLATVHPALTGWATGPYANGMYQVVRGQELAAERGLTYQVLAVVWVHGDGTDDLFYNRRVNGLIQAYNEDIKRMTGQSEDVVFFMEQAHWEPTPGPTAVDREYWEIHRDTEAGYPNGGLAYLVGPRYPESCPIHYGPAAVRAQGARFANAMDQVLFQGWDWQPTSPRAVRVEGRTVEIDFHVPYGPLQVGTTPHLGPVDPALGFVIRDDQGENLVTSAEILDGDTVRLHCAADPRSRLLTYAREKGGAGESQRGFVCDSHPPRGFYEKPEGGEYDARNFAIAFEVPIPWIEAPQSVGTVAILPQPPTDVDEDGLPDWWEMGFFEDLATAGLGTDYDRDGADDESEYWAETDPRDPRDVLRMTSIRVAGPARALEVGWASVTDRRYMLEVSTDLKRWQRLSGVYTTKAMEIRVADFFGALMGPPTFFLRVVVLED